MAPEVSIPVLWAVDGGPHVAGRLDLYGDRLHLDGGSRDNRRTRDIGVAEIASIRIGREDVERIGGRAVLVVELRDGGSVSFTGFQTPGALHELAGQLGAMTQGGAGA